MNEGQPNKGKETSIISEDRREEFKEPELLQVQVDLVALADRMLELRLSSESKLVHFWDIDIDPKELLERLRKTEFGDLLLPEGSSLSFPEENDYFAELGLYANDEDITSISLTAWEQEYDKYRMDPKGPDKSPFDVVSFPGEKDWERRIDIRLWYGKEDGEKDRACQVITVSTGSLEAGGLPDISRDVRASAYAEMGYEGHNQMYRKANGETEIVQFIELATELFQRRVETKE